MSIDARCDVAVRERHRTLDFIGLRAHATAVGLIQLCEELLIAGVLSPEGLDRIKEEICSELAVGKRARVSDQRQFDHMLRRRVDAVFPSTSDVTPCEGSALPEKAGETKCQYCGA